MSFSTTPNQVDFTTFLRGVVGIDPLYLPDNTPVINYALTVSLAIVDLNIANLNGNIYVLAVYNLAADNVINFAPDQTGRTFFKDLRTTFGIGLFVPGVTGSSSDAGTSQSRVTPEFMKNFTLGDLQNLKTPYGRQYLIFAQQFGTLWGIS